MIGIGIKKKKSDRLGWFIFYFLTNKNAIKIEKNKSL